MANEANCRTQLKKLGIEVNGPFERAAEREAYYCINAYGITEKGFDKGGVNEGALYEVANYCTDEKIMKQRALHEILDRLLWRFTYKNGWSEDLWEFEQESKKYIIYIYSDDEFIIRSTFSRKSAAVYFKSEEIATRAINEIIKPFMEEHPDFVW